MICCLFNLCGCCLTLTFIVLKRTAVIQLNTQRIHQFSTVIPIILTSLFKMADKQKVDLGLLEEDDEFEEFPAESECNSLCFYFAQISNFTEY
jgi:hypothetical protein